MTYHAKCTCIILYAGAQQRSVPSTPKGDDDDTDGVISIQFWLAIHKWATAKLTCGQRRHDNDEDEDSDDDDNDEDDGGG